MHAMVFGRSAAPLVVDGFDSARIIPLPRMEASGIPSATASMDSGASSGPEDAMQASALTQPVAALSRASTMPRGPSSLLETEPAEGSDVKVVEAPLAYGNASETGLVSFRIQPPPPLRRFLQYAVHYASVLENELRTDVLESLLGLHACRDHGTLLQAGEFYSKLLVGEQDAISLVDRIPAIFEVTEKPPSTDSPTLHASSAVRKLFGKAEAVSLAATFHFSKEREGNPYVVLARDIQRRLANQRGSPRHAASLFPRPELLATIAEHVQEIQVDMKPGSCGLFFDSTMKLVPGATQQTEADTIRAVEGLQTEPAEQLKVTESLHARAPKVGRERRDQDMLAVQALQARILEEKQNIPLSLLEQQVREYREQFAAAEEAHRETQGALEKARVEIHTLKRQAAEEAREENNQGSHGGHSESCQERSDSSKETAPDEPPYSPKGAPDIRGSESGAHSEGGDYEDELPDLTAPWPLGASPLSNGSRRVSMEGRQGEQIAGTAGGVPQRFDDLDDLGSLSVAAEAVEDALYLSCTGVSTSKVSRRRLFTWVEGVIDFTKSRLEAEEQEVVSQPKTEEDDESEMDDEESPEDSDDQSLATTSTDPADHGFGHSEELQLDSFEWKGTPTQRDEVMSSDSEQGRKLDVPSQDTVSVLEGQTSAADGVATATACTTPESSSAASQQPEIVRADVPKAESGGNEALRDSDATGEERPAHDEPGSGGCLEDPAVDGHSKTSRDPFQPREATRVSKGQGSKLSKVQDGKDESDSSLLDELVSSIFKDKFSDDAQPGSEEAWRANISSTLAKFALKVNKNKLDQIRKRAVASGLPVERSHSKTDIGLMIGAKQVRDGTLAVPCPL